MMIFVSAGLATSILCVHSQPSGLVIKTSYVCPPVKPVAVGVFCAGLVFHTKVKSSSAAGVLPYAKEATVAVPSVPLLHSAEVWSSEIFKSSG